MTRSITKAIAFASVIAIGSLASATPAEAGRGGRAAAAGIIGFAAGALIGSAASRHHYGHDLHYYDYHHYYASPRHVYHHAPYRYSYAPEPWAPDWYSYCHSKYRSFDSRSGTYQPYNGPRRLCR